MTLDFTQQLKQAKRIIDYYQRRNQPIPVRALYIYETLQSLHGSTTSSDSNSDSNSSSSSNNSSDYQGSLQPGIYPTVDTTSSIILENNSSREYVLVQNTGDEAVYIEFNNSANVNQGIKILPGGSWSSDIPQFCQSELHAIVENNTTTLSIYTIN